ncbi:MAG TPA: hypothetical protein P5181_10805 [Dermatophilaceae bacterium]|mgnify:CR=1 FL=1|nr:hypothetical protein [Dermatophilaceae bacterium]
MSWWRDGVSGAEWVALLVLLLVLVGWYLSYSAARLDRLHARVEGTRAALDGQVVRRAEAVLELANSGLLDAASSLMLVSLASESLSASDAAETDTEQQRFTHDRESIESALTESLDLTLDAETMAALDGDDVAAAVLARVKATGQRVQLARRFHNEAVTDVRRMRRKRVVHLFRLAGHAILPGTVEFDDELPTALRG